MENLRSNEFRYLVDTIHEKYFMSHRLISNKLGISNAAFSRYYSGLVEPKKEFIEELNDIFTISEEDIEKAKENDAKNKKFMDIAYKLSNLSDEHKQEIYDMIESYYNKENMTKTMTI